MFGLFLAWFGVGCYFSCAVREMGFLKQRNFYYLGMRDHRAMFIKHQMKLIIHMTLPFHPQVQKVHSPNLFRKECKVRQWELVASSFIWVNYESQLLHTVNAIFLAGSSWPWWSLHVHSYSTIVFKFMPAWRLSIGSFLWGFCTIWLWKSRHPNAPFSKGKSRMWVHCCSKPN